MRRRILRTLVVGVYLSLAVLFSCSVSVGPGGGTVTFTIADKTFTFKLGVFEPFQVTADAEPVRQAAKIPLFDETPSDLPESAAITVDPDSIEAIPLGVAKAQAEAQIISGTATMTVYIDDADSTNPCTNGTNIGTITLSITDSGVTLDRVELDVFGDALAHLLSGTFSICVEIAANINVSITIDQMGCIFGPPVEEPTDNTNDNAGGPDNENDNENVNDNVGGGDVVQITTDPGNELDPQWDPASETIAFQTDRAPAGTNVRNIGSVQANGSGEGNMAVGPNSGFGVGGPMFWVGTTGLLIVNERVVFHEYMTFDTSQALFTRTVNDGDDEAFTRELFITGGGGGDFITVSRDGDTVLWRFSISGGAGTASLRVGPFSSLTGQNADATGTLLFSDVDAVVHTLMNGAALTSNGSQVVISLPSGGGFDLFLYEVSAPPILVRQLTSTGSSLGENNASPDISPDGTQVAFAHTAVGEDTDLYMVGMDGTGLTQLTFTDRSESEPSWSPGGDRIAFQRGDDDGWNIYVLTLGGISPGPECDGDADCASGEECVGGVCVPVIPDCTSSFDCSPDETCVDGACVPVDECTSDVDCASGEACVDGDCVPVEPDCTSNLDCGPDETCVDGTCVVGPAGDEFTTATILHRGSEQIIAGPNVDPMFGTVTPAGYGMGGYKQTALSGDNSKVWFVLRDEFPNVEGDPQNQLRSVNLDGTGGQRSIVPGEDSGYGLGVETNGDGSVCYADYRSAGEMFRATPGAPATLAFDYGAGGYGDIRGQFSISDDATKMVYTSYFDTRFMSVNLTASPNTPVEMANATSMAYLGVNARSLYWDTDITADGSRWTSASQHWSASWDPTIKNTIWVGSGLGAGATPAVHASLDNLPKGNVNITDDGATVAYCVTLEPGIHVPNECPVEAIDGSSSTTVGDGRTTVGALVLSDDGSRVHYVTDSCCSGGTGVFEDVATNQKMPSGTHAFLVDFGNPHLSNDGNTLMSTSYSAGQPGVYVLRDGSDPPPGFPSIGAVSYKLMTTGEDCSFFVRVTATSPRGIETIFANPYIDGVDPTEVVPGAENPMFAARGGFFWAFTPVDGLDNVWEYEKGLTNDAGECVSDRLTSDYRLRVVVKDINETMTVFQDFSLAGGGGGGGGGVPDCSSNGACNADCGDTDPDCAFCDADGVCMAGCPGIDPDCSCSDNSCPGTCVDGVCFAQGDISFADYVITYDNTFGGNPAPTHAEVVNPDRALGAPDYIGGYGTYVSLGQGGLLELGFTDNVLTNSGDSQVDMKVFEIGPEVEGTFVSLRATGTTGATLSAAGIFPDGGWYEIGQIGGSTRSIDIDAYFPGFAPGALQFDGVRLIDDPNQGGGTGGTPGADIDAVGAIATSPM